MSARMDVEGLLPAYVAGELADAERARAELARYQRLFVLLAAVALEEVAPPANLEGRVARQLAVQWSLRSAVSLVDDLVGRYGRAFAYYFGLA